MPRRQSRGRQRIPIQRIENQDDMYATFSKRRLGLYNKASALSTLCSADIGIIIFSPSASGNPCSFFSPTMESVIERYRHPYTQLDYSVRLIDTNARGRTVELNQMLDGILDEKEHEAERANILKEKNKALEKGWWEGIPIEEMGGEQVKELKRWAEFTCSQTIFHKEWLELNVAGRSLP